MKCQKFYFIKRGFHATTQSSLSHTHTHSLTRKHTHRQQMDLQQLYQDLLALPYAHILFPILPNATPIGLCAPHTQPQAQSFQLPPQQQQSLDQQPHMLQQSDDLEHLEQQQAQNDWQFWLPLLCVASPVGPTVSFAPTPCAFPQQQTLSPSSSTFVSYFPPPQPSLELATNKQKICFVNATEHKDGRRVCAVCLFESKSDSTDICALLIYLQKRKQMRGKRLRWTPELKMAFESAYNELGPAGKVTFV